MVEEHVPVLRERVVEAFASAPRRILVDGTIGVGGHAAALLAALPQVRLIGLDRDAEALERSRRNLVAYAERLQLVHGNFAELDKHLVSFGVDKVDGVLLDLGMSSLQIDRSDRGFSYLRDGPLDMRMDRSATTTAADLLQKATESEIARVLWEFGEERLARKIARSIVQQRSKAPLRTTAELAALVRRSVSGRKPVSSLARVFQGVRMWVNGELENLCEGLERVLGVLAPGSLLAVLSYHSLEDRMVKQFFSRQVDGCICPPALPRCGCGFVPGFELVSRRAIQPQRDEIEGNPRARSARLRLLRRAA